MDLLNFILAQIIRLREIFASIPMTFFKDGAKGNLAVFFFSSCGAGVLFTAMYERWFKS